MRERLYAEQRMTRQDEDAVRRSIASFRAEGEVESVSPHGEGHIHRSFVVTLRDGSQRRRLLVQQLNQHVFTDLDAVMGNLARVTAQLAHKLALTLAKEPERRVLEIIPTRDAELYARLPDGTCYRAFRFIEGALSLRFAQSEPQAFEAGQAFGHFGAALCDLPGPALAQTIPGFHDTEARLAALRQAAHADPLGRARGVRAELDFAEVHAELASLFAAAVAAGELPQRIAHNDAKLDNLLFDAQSQRGLCVVDLDTVMPGLWLHDFGDLVRLVGCPVAEDEREPGGALLHLPYFDALARGYIAALGHMFSQAEWEYLPVAGKIVTYELGMRFLTDYLLGDRYFKVQHEAHNLERARAQFRLVTELLRQQDQLRASVAALRIRG